MWEIITRQHCRGIRNSNRALSRGLRALKKKKEETNYAEKTLKEGYIPEKGEIRKVSGQNAEIRCAKRRKGPRKKIPEAEKKLK